MKFGLAVTTSVSPAVTGPAQADYVGRVAQAAEQSGFDSVWVSDRTVYPADLPARHPDRFGPGRANPAGQNVLEAITTLSYLAGLVPTVRLGFSVLVLPFRDPVLNAKMITTLDVLSGGRVNFGLGVGWMPEEFRAMAASYSSRGRTADDHIRAFKALCSQTGPYPAEVEARMAGMVFFPPPVQQPHPPLWVGGNSRAAMRRAARFGDAWHSIRLSPAEVTAQGQVLGQLCADYGRRPDQVQLSLQAMLALGESKITPTGEREPLSGTPGQIRDDLKRYQAAGLDYLVLSVSAPSEQAALDDIEIFAGEVVGRL